MQITVEAFAVDALFVLYLLLAAVEHPVLNALLEKLRLHGLLDPGPSLVAVEDERKLGTDLLESDARLDVVFVHSEAGS